MKQCSDEIAENGFGTQKSLLLLVLSITLILVDVYYLVMSWFMYTAANVLLELHLLCRDDNTISDAALTVN